MTAVAVGSSVLVASPASAATSGTSDVYTTDEDTPLELSAGGGVLANDGDSTTALTAVLVTTPVAVAPAQGDSGSVVLAADGSFLYTPGRDFSGTAMFTYATVDADGESTPIAVTIDVNPVNDSPIATADAYATTQDDALTVERTGSSAGEGVLWNDNDADGDPLSAVLVSPPDQGALTLGADGSFSYIPAPGFAGVDEFAYRATDDVVASDPVVVTITVRPLPITIIASGPPVLTNARTAQFTVTSNRADATIQCSIDGGPFAVCTSPVSFGGLTDGLHTLVARSLTLDGLLDVVAPSWTWTVDATAPVLTLASPAAGSAFTQGQSITPSATCIDNGVELVAVLGPVDTATVGASFVYSASCSDGAGNTATATVNYSVVAPPPPADEPPVVEPPVVKPSFDVRWRSGDDHSADDGSALASLDGAKVAGRIRLILTDASGAPVGREDSVRIATVQIVDASGRVVLGRCDRWSGFGFARNRRRSVVIDTSRLSNGSYRLETSVVGDDGSISALSATFEVANAPRRQHHHGWGYDRD